MLAAAYARFLTTADKQDTSCGLAALAALREALAGRSVLVEADIRL